VTGENHAFQARRNPISQARAVLARVPRIWTYGTQCHHRDLNLRQFGGGASREHHQTTERKVNPVGVPPQSPPYVRPWDQAWKSPVLPFGAAQQQQWRNLDDARRRLDLISQSAKRTLVQDPPVKVSQEAEKMEWEKKIANLEAKMLSSALLFAIPSSLLSALFAWLGSRAAQSRRHPDPLAG
jgi:hypothetical protein